MRRPLPLFALLAAGCNPATSLVESAIEAELPALFGPADHYAVQIDGLRLGASESTGDPTRLGRR